MSTARTLACAAPQIMIGLFMFGSFAHATGTLYTFYENGPRDKRLNIVLFGDGYTAAEEAQFVADAGGVLSYLLTTPPFQVYGSYYNGYGVFVPSNESGSDHPSDPEGIDRDTYFNSSYDSYGIQRCITIPPNSFDPTWANGMGKVFALLGEHVPEFDAIAMIVNDPQYGGCASNGLACLSVDPSLNEVFMHELGHSFAGLADEYDYGCPPSCGSTEGPNVTRETQRNQIRWHLWIDPATPIPTPEISTYADDVGLFEGAAYTQVGVYRPMLNCKMQSLYVGYCPVCTEELVKTQYEELSPIESYSPPETGPVFLMINQSRSIRMIPMQPYQDFISIQWFVDGMPEAGSPGDSLVLVGANLGVGLHQAAAVVMDTTPLVRNDHFRLTFDSVAWNVEVGCLCPCHGDPSCDGGVDVLDVVAATNVAFRGTPAPTDLGCIIAPTDANCDGETDVIDVVLMVGAAFRGADPAVTFCHPCV